ncbi:MAG: cation:proton antiporter [Betaproteobacteria bacterium]|jgi:CPA2 family monovalent cation:H+ antiporter-2
MPTILKFTLILLASSLAGVLISKVLKLPSILGYLFVGLLIGPNALGLVPDNQTVKDLAEFGVVFLMFSIGLEFNLKKLKSMKSIVFGFGASQVLLTMFLTIPAGYFLRFVIPLPMPWHVLFALGGAIAMSSTALVVKILSEKNEIESPHGRNAIGVLLFQDLVVILLLILIPSLGKNSGDIFFALSMTALKVAIALILIFFIGQKIFSTWFGLIARFKSQELFMLNVLLISLGLSAVTSVVGLSLALGAFMAGMLISETPYRYQVEESIASFRDILLGLFFISIGMLVNIPQVLSNFHLVIFLLVGALFLKFSVIALLAKRFGSSPGEAIRTGLCLTQAGEFGFVLINQIDSLDWIDPSLSQSVIAAMLLSMMIAPIVIQFNGKIALRFSQNEWLNQSLKITQIASQGAKKEKHIIICGFGITGQYIAKFLEEEGVNYIALDSDPERVKEASTAGLSVVYGVSQSANHLNAASISRASAVVITFQDMNEIIRVIHQIQILNPKIPVIVRATDESEIDKLHNAGATQVIPEKTEGGLMMAANVLSLSGVPISKVLRRVTQARENRYGKLRGYFPSTEDEDDESSIRLHSIQLKRGDKGIGCSSSIISHSGAILQTLRRKNHQVGVVFRKLDLTEDQILEEQDILIILGNPESLERAERALI